MAANIFDDLDQALDAESWNYLSENLPTVAGGVFVSVSRGATPEDIRRRVMGKTQRYELALRCEQAANHLQRAKA